MNLGELFLYARGPILLFALGMAIGALFQATKATTAPKAPPSKTSSG
jgi:hypothetical protein